MREDLDLIPSPGHFSLYQYIIIKVSTEFFEIFAEMFLLKSELKATHIKQFSIICVKSLKDIEFSLKRNNFLYKWSLFYTSKQLTFLKRKNL